ncbi:MAG: hypothetical protein DRH90_04315 [Deltaproteobacteria bacterium]|nr:MAG: hypothetical protein DRH90_04315 [Deltaproteobacteria bacterium]
MKLPITIFKLIKPLSSLLKNLPVRMVGLAAVYSREINGQTLTFAPSGWTYKKTFVLYDKETGTLWYPKKKGLMRIQGVFFKRSPPEVKE